jgi:hypothetical protein
MIIKQLSVFLENTSGRLTEVSETLGAHNINMSAFSLADTSEYGILRVIVSDPLSAIECLKEKGFSVSLTDVICLVVPHTPGALSKALRILSDHDVSIEYMYAFAVNDLASVVIRTDEAEKAVEALQEHKMELMKADDIIF